MKHLLILCLVLNALVLFCCFNLGMDYINLGYGLHPAIAFPVCFAVLGLTFVIYRHLSTDYGMWIAKSHHR